MYGETMTTFDEYLNFEKEKQGFFDDIYKDLGWEIDRDQNKYWDLTIKKDKYTFRIEEKARKITRDDILVEIIQDTSTNHPGWIYYTKADFLIYGMFGDPVVVYRLNMDNFKKWFEQNEHFYSEIASDEGWGHTINKAIPISHLSHNIIKKIYPKQLLPQAVGRVGVDSSLPTTW